MKKFLILFCAPEPMSSFMNKFTANEIASGIEAWTNWLNSIDKNIQFEFGGVIEAVDRLKSNSATEFPNQASNFAYAKADSKIALRKALQNHPHLLREGAYIDILEVLSFQSST